MQNIKLKVHDKKVLQLLPNIFKLGKKHISLNARNFYVITKMAMIVIDDFFKEV